MPKTKFTDGFSPFFNFRKAFFGAFHQIQERFVNAISHCNITRLSVTTLAFVVRETSYKPCPKIKLRFFQGNELTKPPTRSSGRDRHRPQMPAIFASAGLDKSSFLLVAQNEVTRFLIT